MFMIRDSTIVVDTDGDMTRKKVNKEFITRDDLKTYQKILTMTNALLTRS